MAKTAVQSGDILSLDPGATVSSGDVIAIGAEPNVIAGVALTDGVSGTAIAVGVKGVYDVAKTTGAAWAVGQRILLDAGNQKGITTGGANQKLGICVEAAASAATSGKVLLFGAPENTSGAGVLTSGQIDITAATSGTNGVGAAYDGKVVRTFMLTSNADASVRSAVVASGTLTVTITATATAKVFFEVLDIDVA